ELLTAAQMRAIEQAAIDAGEVTGLELMERAGRGVVEAILEWRPELAKTAHRAVVLCGPGNNGGDGFVVARLLKDRGWDVEVFLYGDEKKLPPDAAENAKRWRETGDISPLCALEPEEINASVVVDAVFGIGLSRPIDGRGIVAEMLGRAMAECEDSGQEDPPFLVAIDVPSGLDADSGRALGFEMEAMLTVTFHRAKAGHFLADGPVCAVELVVVDLGLTGGSSLKVTAAPVSRFGSTLEKRNPLTVFANHKYTYGHALVLSGRPGKGGAARLAARGALRIGAGVVTVGCPPAAVIENAARLDAVMLRSIAGPAAFDEILADQRINALCLGPGFGVGAGMREMVAVALSTRRGTVLDADALTSFAEDPAALFADLHGACVLTPHAGEFGRLFPDIHEKLNAPATRGPAYSKVDATREAAARAGCVVLFKGADTVIAASDGRCSINSAHYERAAPWLATAGSGDVLAGFITGLLARGLDPMQAAEAAAWLHVECALKFGPGLIAEDLPEQLPAVFRDLGL
ncbi:MAG: NAD(P)H-hydrate dehydratase, partial [Pseudomonadota bacterium]